MRRSTSSLSLLLVFCGVVSSAAWSSSASAQPPVAPPPAAAPPAAAPPVPPAPAPAADDVTPPSLKVHAEAAYPEEALRDRLETTVTMELDVDAAGKVTGARVVSPAGHGFDEAAVAAAQKFAFEPARRGGAPIASTVQFAYEFHLPPAPPPAVAKATPPAVTPLAVQPVPPGGETQTGADQSTLVLAQRPISAASSFAVRDRDFQLRPIGSVQDILRVTPGLVLVQHSGGGKANQYFLRGFDADHGTDLALSIDGIPINMVSHAHGQGFSDTNFIIPETVERVEITKGPYFANQGDFATAGSVNMVTRDDFEHSSVGFGVGGSPGHGAPSYRGLLIASPKLDKLKTMFAAEVGRQDGPFDNPEGWDKYKLFNKLTYQLTPTSSIALGESSYASNWHGSGQIPARAVESGQITRFGSVDPNEGGNTARHQLFVSYKVRPTEASEITALAFVGAYRFNLFSNFTLYARDPENGDEIQQVDRRSFFGGKVSYRAVREVERVRFDTTIGANMRNDDIHDQLFDTREREVLRAVRDNNVHETTVGAFVNEEVTPVKWLRVNAGGRADFFGFAVDQNLASNDPTGGKAGVTGASQFSPKASVIATPIERDQAQVDVYANYGHGFHSNDARGIFSTPAVTPLSRAIGSEVGSRARLFDRWDVAAALWQLDLKSETVWNGDDGTSSASDPTHRYGVELETRVEILPWLSADGDVTFTKSYFSTGGSNGGGLALAPKQTWSGGLSARHPSGLRGGLRFYGIGDRPASDDGALIAPGFTQFDLHLGYRHRRFDVALDVENLFNGSYRSAQFDTVSRLRGEPPLGKPAPAGFGCGSKGRVVADPSGNFGGCEDVNYTPAYPLTARIMTTLYLD